MAYADMTVLGLGFICLGLLAAFCFYRGGKDYPSAWRK